MEAFMPNWLAKSRPISLGSFRVFWRDIFEWLCTFEQEGVQKRTVSVMRWDILKLGHPMLQLK